MRHLTSKANLKREHYTMKRTNLRCAVLCVAIAMALTLSATKVPLQSAHAQPSGQTQEHIGAAYGSRDPHTCEDTKKPLRGAPSAEQAKQYVVCGLEHVFSYSLYLAEDVKVEVGGAVPYNPNNFPFASDIDTKSPVYPIRASFNEYQCGKEYKSTSHPLYNVGKNCTIYHIPKATGVCLKTTFGDWRCSITSRTDDPNPPKRNVAPPPPAKTGG